ncbi:GYD domain-containing protein [Arthrobacter sp. ISL-69]|uniref:GYD domain-containing protein n=1 Tax=Arthrobacter sp. ISL-69 TaxID=2819113 RepID=UPI002035CAE2|nr:GYD domain-containing protein [Arthrobacter sp. ISL-69]
MARPFPPEKGTGIAARTGDCHSCCIGTTGAQERKDQAMPLYLSKFSYTPETWARLTSNPEDRRKAAQAYIESVGGKLHGFWYAFGSHDGYNLWEAPDNVSMAAVALAISGGGALSSFDTTVLLTVEETLEALRKAEQIKYRPPGT